jgi:hypothetical protein
LEGKTGGDKVNKPVSARKSQIEIESTNLDSDRAMVEEILLAAANKFNLYDNSHTSRVPNTIRSIVEGDGFGFGLGARVVQSSIFVDFLRSKNSSQKFNDVHAFILGELREVFEMELQEVWEGDPDYFSSL